MLTRLVVESGKWDDVAKIPLRVPSRDFAAVKLHWEAKAAALRKNAAAASTAAAKLVSLSQEPGQHPFAKLIISLQAKGADGFAAEAAGDSETAVARLKEAVAMEDSIDDPPQPPYPVIPANELCGNLLLELNRPAEAATYFQRALRRTPNRPKLVFGHARAAEGAECVVYFFGAGQGGSVRANIERWNGQFTSNGKTATAKIQKRTVHGLPVTTIDVTGQYSGMGGPMATTKAVIAGYRLLGAIIENTGGSVFLKFTGPEKVIVANQQKFEQMLESFVKE
jgi:hypothetical protein